MASRTILIKQFRSVRITEISLTSVHEEQIDLADDEHEPSNVIQRKVEAVAELLGCTEAEAQRIVLDHQ